MTRLVDLVMASAVLALGVLIVVPLSFLVRLIPTRPHARRIAYLGTGQIAQVFPRNGANLFLERECSDFDGYFEQLWNVHFPAGARGAMSLTPRHHLIDFDVELPPMLGRRYLRTGVALREVCFLAWLVVFARRHHISILTATNPFLQGLNAAVAGRLLGLPYAVIITRDFDWDWRVLRKRAFASVFPSRAIERSVGQWVLRHADLVLADRAYYAEFALRNGAARDRTVTTRVLADAAYADVVTTRSSRAVRHDLGLDDAPLLAYVGRLDADKFPIDLVECLAIVRRRFPTARLACAGTGALTEGVCQRARELGIEDGLRLLGALGLDELPQLLATADVVVAAHMGYTLVEAGLAGAPVVTYAYDFHTELIEDGVSGLLAPFRDVPALAERVCRVLADPAAGRALGERLRADLVRNHSLEAVVPLYRHAYDRVLGAAAA